MPSTAASAGQGLVYALELDFSSWPNQSGRILRFRPDGSELTEIVTGLKHLPDGIAIDSENGHIYWSNMGVTPGTPWDGSIERCDLDGKNVTTIVPQGVIHTPKQITIARPKGRAPQLYWCDREGFRVMRSNLDGSNVETLVQTGTIPKNTGDMTRWCVGIAVDIESGYMYWTQKGPSKGNAGRIFRAPLDMREGESPDARTDIQLLFEKLPEPIDLHIDVKTKILYWTDRGDPPSGNTVNCARVENTGGGDDRVKYLEKRILTRKLHEGIGLALDEENGRMFFTDLLGGIYSANTDGSDKKVLFADVGDCTGIAFTSQ